LNKSNHSTVVNYIKKDKLFIGEWYFSNSPFNFSDIPLISDLTSIESNNLILDIKNNSHIKKAIFVYDLNNNFILTKFYGIAQAKKQNKY